MHKTLVLQIANHLDKIVNLGCIVTGLYNVAVYHRKHEWQSTGKIPNYYQQYYTLRTHKLAALLHSHVAQQVFRTVEYNYRGWFALREHGHQKANSPSFRSPGKPSTFHFTNYGFKILDDAHIRLSTRNAFRENLIVRVCGRPDVHISKIQKPKILRFVFKPSRITAHLVYEGETTSKPANDRVLAVDLGIKNLAVTHDTFQRTRIYKGGKILSISYYYGKKIAKLQSSLPRLRSGKSRKSSALISRLYDLKNAQSHQILHSYANDIRRYCVQNDIRTVVVGNLTGIRVDAKTGNAKDLGNRTNAKLHAWPFAWFTKALAYKLGEAGIRLATVSERYTSRTCPVCGDKSGKNRPTRGSFKCSKCGYAGNSDVIGAMNILTRYQRGALAPSCNSRVSSGTVVKWNETHLSCTEAPIFQMRAAH